MQRILYDSSLIDTRTWRENLCVQHGSANCTRLFCARVVLLVCLLWCWCGCPAVFVRALCVCVCVVLLVCLLLLWFCCRCPGVCVCVCVCVCVFRDVFAAFCVFIYVGILVLCLFCEWSLGCRGTCWTCRQKKKKTFRGQHHPLATTPVTSERLEEATRCFLSRVELYRFLPIFRTFFLLPTLFLSKCIIHQLVSTIGKSNGKYELEYWQCCWQLARLSEPFSDLSDFLGITF